LYRILSYIHFEYRYNIEEYYKVLHSCMLVNKSWFIILFKLVYRKPHFKSKESFLQFIETMIGSSEREAQGIATRENDFFKIRNYHDFVKHLHISSICYPSNDDIYNLSDAHLKIDTLELEDCRIISDNSLYYLLEKIPNLSELKLNANKNLTDFTIQNIYNCNKKLIKLSIKRQSRFSKFGFNILTKCCSGIRSLELSHLNGLNDTFFQSWCRESIDMNYLERLDIKHCNSITNKGIQQALLASANLKKLSFSLSNTVNIDALKVNKYCCRNLEYLEIDNMDYDNYELNIFHLFKGIKNLPHLKVLSLIASVKIGSLKFFIPKLLEACPTLEKLYILPLSLSKKKKDDELIEEIKAYNSLNLYKNLIVFIFCLSFFFE